MPYARSFVHPMSHSGLTSRLRPSDTMYSDRGAYSPDTHRYAVFSLVRTAWARSIATHPISVMRSAIRSQMMSRCVTNRPPSTSRAEGIRRFGRFGGGSSDGGCVVIVSGFSYGTVMSATDASCPAPS